MINRIWEDLANAVVLQAVEDYREARNITRVWPDEREAQKRIREVERFMRFGWFELLTRLDGKALLNFLKNEEPDPAASDAGRPERRGSAKIIC